jgi:hypothetical protein
MAEKTTGVSYDLGMTTERAQHITDAINPLTQAEYINHIHRQIPDMVKVIVSESGDEKRHGTLEQYRKTNETLDGIPEWKVSLLIRSRNFNLNSRH